MVDYSHSSWRTEKSCLSNNLSLQLYDKKMHQLSRQRSSYIKSLLNAERHFFRRGFFPERTHSESALFIHGFAKIGLNQIKAIPRLIVGNKQSGRRCSPPWRGTPFTLSTCEVITLPKDVTSSTNCGIWFQHCIIVRASTTLVQN